MPYRPRTALLAGMGLRQAPQDSARADTTRQQPTDPLPRFLGAFTFRNLGPAAYSGRVTALAVPRPYKKTIYVGTDGGRTWRSVGLAETRAIGRIVIHPANPDIVYVAALGHLWGPHRERGVYKTVDGGRTWSKLLFVDDTTGFVDLEMDPSNPEVLYAAAWHRLRRGGARLGGG